MKLFLSLVVFLFVFSASDASACATCYGDKGSEVTMAISQSILFMLGLLACVLGGIVAFFARIIIRSARMPVPDEEILAIVQPQASTLPS